MNLTLSNVVWFLLDSKVDLSNHQVHYSYFNSGVGSHGFYQCFFFFFNLRTSRPKLVQRIQNQKDNRTSTVNDRVSVDSPNLPSMSRDASFE